MFDEITTFVIPIKAVPRLQRRAALLILKTKYCFNYFFVSLIIFSNIYFIIFIKSLWKTENIQKNWKLIPSNFTKQGQLFHRLPPCELKAPLW